MKAKQFPPAVLVLLLVLVFGSAFGQEMEPTKDGVEVIPNVNLSNDQLAARFLNQATAGATPNEIASLSAALATHPKTAFSDWLNDQCAKPAQPQDFSLDIFRGLHDGKTAQTGYTHNYTDAQELRGSLMISDRSNELRRMAAYALSQIFVVSDVDSPLAFGSEGMCDYYDMLYRDAFKDFATILSDVTYHPAMSDYLSSEGNAKAGFYNKNSRPDENYAREVMQLFTIGLVQLNDDASIVADAKGHSIPTYTQPDITEVARIFTGLKYPLGPSLVHVKKGLDGKPGLATEIRPVRYGRDEIKEERHDNGEKVCLGTKFPAGQDTAKDIGDFLHFLSQHPNTAPFISKQMIQRLVTSNPTPAYIKRVTQNFRASNGDMKKVISAILLDEEARDPANARRDTYGKLRDPWLRLTGLARAFNAVPAATQPFYGVAGKPAVTRLGQYPLSAPSVFNFYLPNYQPPGTISARNANATDTSTLLAAPEFQIMNSNTALLTPNYLMDTLRAENGTNKRPAPIALDLAPQVKLAGDPAALVNNISTILTGGMMSIHSRNIIAASLNTISPTSDPAVLKERARMAIYLTMASPDYAVQK